MSREGATGGILFMEAVREDGKTAGGTPALRRRGKNLFMEPAAALLGAPWWAGYGALITNTS